MFKKRKINLKNFEVNVIENEDADALIPVEEINGIFKSIAETSVAFRTLTRLPNMSSKTSRMKVEDMLPLVYWQSSPTALKKTTKMAWKNKYITAEEIAVFILVSEQVLDDAEYDIWGEARPKIVEAIANKIDSAIFFGKDAPSSFPPGLVESARTAGHVIVKTGNETFYALISDAMGAVEADGFDVNGIMGGPALKKRFRDMLDTTGRPLGTDNEIAQLPRYQVRNGSWDESVASALLGDFKQAVFSVRQDVTYKLITEGVISDPVTGEIMYNLAQQDMVALRVTFRMGWQIPNPVNRIQPDEKARLPFAVLATSALGINLTLAQKEVDGGVEVSANADVAGAKIYYTVDGSTPTSASTEYTAPVKLTSSATFKAIAIKQYYQNSDVESETVTIA